ncbi:CRE-SNF-5 protein, partial [Aphelenchoides avenae]
AFLIPYFSCSFIIGFPMLYLELTLGQFARVGPAVAYGRLRPALQGIGWAMVCMSLLVCIYYNMVVAWTLIYLFKIVTGSSSQWASCRNDYNTAYCSSSMEDDRCTNELSAQMNGSITAFYFNSACYSVNDSAVAEIQAKMFADKSPTSPAEEFFENYVLEKTATLDTLGGVNFKLVLAYAVAWLITGLVLRKGVKLIGKVAFITATVPYVIIAILFAKSVTLEGAIVGMDFYILKPDLSAVWNPAAWRAAATHVSYSLSIGFGGILSMSSFNPSHHNCFRDAAIITIADALMSVFGGTAVFSVLGFMATQLNVPVTEVVQSGTSLAFVAYPEALSRMAVSWLWALLFFVMILLLGVSTQFGFAECICTALHDQFPLLRAHKAKTVAGVCVALYFCGFIMCTRAGVFFFNIFNDYSSSFALAFVLFLELVLICYIYGWREYITDLRSMFGWPKNKFTAFFGATGHYVAFIWRFVAPLQCVVIFVFALMTQATYDLTYGKGNRLYVLPRWCIAFGWFLSILPLLFLPVFAFANYFKFKRQGIDSRELMRLQKKWPSYARHAKQAATEHTNGDGIVHRVPVRPTESDDAFAAWWEGERTKV